MRGGIRKRKQGVVFRSVMRLSALLAVLSAGSVRAQGPPPPPLPAGSPQAAGRQIFVTRCASCHGTNATGGEFAPAIVDRVPLRTDDELVKLLHNGIPSSGMPPFPDIVDQDRANLISFLRTLKPFAGSAAERSSVTLENGKTLQGTALSSSASDMQLLGDDHQLYLLRKTQSGQYRSVTSQADWPSYNGQTAGSRYSELAQITSANVSRLEAKWIFTLSDIRQSQNTPIVSEGVMYVTSSNQCFALDAGSGREIWHFQRSRTQGLHGNAGQGANRGAAIAGDRVFMATDNAHLLALNRTTGALLWGTPRR